MYFDNVHSTHSKHMKGNVHKEEKHHLSSALNHFISHLLVEQNTGCVDYFLKYGSLL